jgi:hypothetical protein
MTRALFLRLRRAAVFSALLPTVLVAQSRRTEHVVLIVSDGIRWQEVFRGAEQTLISRTSGGVADTTALRRDFWRADTAERRSTLMPFLWNAVAHNGQLYGNQDRGRVAVIQNRFKFSYPGYSELFTGFADERIDSNDYPPNPNVTVFEWLARRPEFRGKVGAVATWDAFGRIFNRERAGIDVLFGWNTPFPGETDATSRRAMLNEIYQTGIRYWPSVSFDAPMHQVAKEYIRSKQPRVMFIGYGETDEWAHGRRYDLMLRATRQVDDYIEDLWTMMQAMPEYRDRTTFIITTDHGRGSGADDWTSHGERVDGAEHIWMAVLGPDTPPRGELVQTMRVTQSQVAATIAAALGLEREFLSASPRSASPLGEAIAGRR